MQVSLLNIFGAGTGTTNTAMRWGILFLLHNQDIQKRLRDEIEKVVGSSRYPAMKDQASMPYTVGFLTEVWRRGSIAALGVPHGSRDGFTYKGYEFPPDCIIIPNLHSVNYDPEVFPDPMKVDPTRYLDANGQLNGKERDIITFSTGKINHLMLISLLVLKTDAKTKYLYI